MRTFVPAIPLFVMLLAATACQGSTEPAWESALAKAQWNDRRPAAYSYIVRRSCECSTESAGPVTVSVDGATVTRRYTATNADVPASLAEFFPTVDGLFDIIAAARRDDVARLDVDYDPTYGFPTRVWIDRDVQVQDEEILYRATDFVIPVR